MNGEIRSTFRRKSDPRTFPSALVFASRCSISSILFSDSRGDDDHVPVRIEFAEQDLIERVKAAKGRWNPDEKLWFITYGNIRGTALAKHIVLDAAPGR